MRPHVDNAMRFARFRADGPVSRATLLRVFRIRLSCVCRRVRSWFFGIENPVFDDGFGVEVARLRILDALSSARVGADEDQPDLFD